MSTVVEELVTFIRTPTWITAGFAQSKAGPGGANFSFTQKQKDEFRNDPVKYTKYRKEIENELNRRFRLVRFLSSFLARKPSQSIIADSVI